MYFHEWMIESFLLSFKKKIELEAPIVILVRHLSPVTRFLPLSIYQSIYPFSKDKSGPKDALPIELGAMLLIVHAFIHVFSLCDDLIYNCALSFLFACLNASPLHLRVKKREFKSLILLVISYLPYTRLIIHKNHFIRVKWSIPWKTW